MNVRYIDNPLGEMKNKSYLETDLDVLAFTRYRGMDKTANPISLIRFSRYYADGNPLLELNVSGDSLNNLFPPILCNLTELTASLYSVLRNPNNATILHEYQTHLSSLKIALYDAHMNMRLQGQYEEKYLRIFREKYGWNIPLMAEIFTLYAGLTENYVTSSSQCGVSAYERARKEGLGK